MKASKAGVFLKYRLKNIEPIFNLSF